jgi:fructosamine-3-kinase
VSIWDEVAERIGEHTGRRFRPEAPREVGGGSISRSVVLAEAERRYFVKLAAPGQRAMFEAEMAGLRLLAEPGGVRVPEPICAAEVSGGCFLALEFIDFGRARGADSDRRLGQGLAVIHRRLGDHFGWTRDNTIGSTPQINTPDDDWPRFFARHRLGYQLDLAGPSGHAGSWLDAGRRLLERLPLFFEDYRPLPSLVHGDLWGGNAAFDRDGRPVLFDPAVHFADRESDLAMTELFGGFEPAFYSAYEAAWPLHEGYDRRRGLYQLYHVLNHLNLFGGGYRAQAQRLIERLLAEAG